MFALKYEVANDTKEKEFGIESVRDFNLKSVSRTLFVRILHKILFFREKEEANEIKRIQNNYFLFAISENIYICMCLGRIKLLLVAFQK